MCHTRLTAGSRTRRRVAGVVYQPRGLANIFFPNVVNIRSPAGQVQRDLKGFANSYLNSRSDSGPGLVKCPEVTRERWVQEDLVHKKQLPPLGPPQGLRLSPTVGS